MRSEHSFGNRIFLTEGRIIVQTKGQAKEKTIKNIENKWNYINHCCCFPFLKGQKNQDAFHIVRIQMK